MDSIQSMNAALAYIEEHLTDDIDYGEVARIARCSEFHFARMFSFLSGIGLSDYVRRRRLTLAAADLSCADLRIIDVATKYGYTSADAFSRAFQSLHGTLPSEARAEAVRLSTYPKMTFQLTLNGANEMNYRIVQKGPFTIVGFSRRVPIVFEGVNPAISEMATLLTPDAIVKLKTMSDVEPSGIISASTSFDEGRMIEEGELDHYIGVATTSGDPEGFSSLAVDGGTWAVFESVGPFPETLQAVWGRIYSEWFPSSGYESVPGPEITWHESPDTTNPQYRSEIWIPVKKAAS